MTGVGTGGTGSGNYLNSLNSQGPQRAKIGHGQKASGPLNRNVVNEKAYQSLEGNVETSTIIANDSALMASGLLVGGGTNNVNTGHEATSGRTSRVRKQQVTSENYKDGFLLDPSDPASPEQDVFPISPRTETLDNLDSNTKFDEKGKNNQGYMYSTLDPHRRPPPDRYQDRHEHKAVKV